MFSDLGRDFFTNFSSQVRVDLAIFVGSIFDHVG